MNISALLGPTPLWFIRHLLVHCLLGVFPKSHDQWIEFNDRAKAYVDLRDPEVRNVFLKQSFEPHYIKLASKRIRNLIRYLENRKACFLLPPSRWCGTSRFQFDAHHTGHSHVDAGGISAQENVVLDDYLERQGVDRVTFLKMDLEGHELSGLRGLSRAFSGGAIDVIYFEVRSKILQRYDVVPEQVSISCTRTAFVSFTAGIVI
jgi:hypothetical protein